MGGGSPHEKISLKFTGHAYGPVDADSAAAVVGLLLAEAHADHAARDTRRSRWIPRDLRGNRHK